MLQEKQKLQTQSKRDLNLAKQRFAALEEQLQKEKNAYMNELKSDQSAREALAEARSQEKSTEQQLDMEHQQNNRLLNAQKLLANNLETIQMKDKAALLAKETDFKALKRTAQEQLQRIGSLQDLAGRTAAQLKTSTAAETAAKSEISNLNKVASGQKAQIMNSLKEIASLQEKLELQAQSETALARQSLQAQTEAKNEMSLKEQEYNALSQKYSLSEQEASSAKAKVEDQSMQLQKLHTQLAAAQAAAKTEINDLQKQLHTVMQDATTKVRALQDQQEESKEILQKKEAALIQANTEATAERQEAAAERQEADKASREEQ